MLQQNNQNPSGYDLAVGFLQVFDLLLNLSQTSNDELMKELQHQNKDYFEKIIANQEEILRRISGE